MPTFPSVPPHAHRALTVPCVSNAVVAASLTCRRSASPRATGLGTGTEAAAAAHPSPVPPWSSSLWNPECWLVTGNRGGAGHTHTPTWLRFRALYAEERLTTLTQVHLMASPASRSVGQMDKRRKRKKKSATSCFFLPCVNVDLLHYPRAAATGRLHPSACAEASLRAL